MTSICTFPFFVIEYDIISSVVFNTSFCLHIYLFSSIERPFLKSNKSQTYTLHNIKSPEFRLKVVYQPENFLFEHFEQSLRVWWVLVLPLH